MKILFASISLLFFFQSTIILSQDKGLGVGVILGDPTGLTAKYWTSELNAVDLGIGYSFMGAGSGLAIHVDYLYHVHSLIKSEEKLPVYYGFGLRFRFPTNESNVFGVRGVVGILWYPKTMPVEFFAELAPSFRLLPDAALDFSFGIGGRYYLEL